MSTVGASAQPARASTKVIRTASRQVTAGHRHVSFPELRGGATFTRGRRTSAPDPAGAHFAAASVVEWLLVLPAGAHGVLVLIPPTAIQVPSSPHAGNQSRP